MSKEDIVHKKDISPDETKETTETTETMEATETIETVDDEELLKVALRILEEHRAAFEELAK